MRKSSSDITTKLLEICMVYLPVNSRQYKVIARLLMIVNCNIAREWHVITYENKSYFSVEACKNISKYRKSHKSCVFEIANILLYIATKSITPCELTLPTIDTVNFSTCRYASVACRLE